MVCYVHMLHATTYVCVWQLVCSVKYVKVLLSWPCLLLTYQGTRLSHQKLWPKPTVARLQVYRGVKGCILEYMLENLKAINRLSVTFFCLVRNIIHRLVVGPAVKCGNSVSLSLSLCAVAAFLFFNIFVNFRSFFL